MPDSTPVTTKLSIILPTYNERENLPILVAELQSLLRREAFEIIVVDDDSPDGTWAVARELGLAHPYIQVIRRIGRRGLTSAAVEGLLLAKGSSLAVMDADLQHDIRLLPRMLAEIRQYDVVIGSRTLSEETVPGLNRRRLRISRVGTILARRLLKQEVKDPLSGFFMIRRDLIHRIAPALYGQGFKILLDILLRAPEVTVKEIPFEFQKRLHGESKLDMKVMLDFGDLLLSRTFLGRFRFPFVRFSVIAGAAVACSLVLLSFLSRLLQLPHGLSLIVSVEAAVITSYVLHNPQPFASQRPSSLRWRRGLLRYNGACLVGSLCTLAFAWYPFSWGQSWFWAAALGLAVGVCWIWMVSRSFAWER